MLLIDEIDRADDEFEAFLLEFLSDFAVTIPELGTVTRDAAPVVLLTSNRTRELHDALKRRCLYHWIDYPDAGARAGDRPRADPGRAGGDRRAGRRRRSAGCASRATCTSCPAWGRRSCGRRRCWRSATTPTSTRRSGGAQGPRGRGAGARAEGARGCLSRCRSSGLSALAGAAARAGRRGSASASCSTAHRALAAVDAASREDARLALRAVLCSGQRGPRALRAGVRGRVRRRRRPAATQSARGARARSSGRRCPRAAIPGRPAPRDRRGGASRRRSRPPGASVELLRDKDFAALHRGRDGARARADRAARAPRPDAALAPARGRPAGAATRPTCGAWCAPRCGPAASRSSATGGRRRTRPRPVVLVCDVSGSMAPYARMLLQYLHACVAARRRVEAFAFGTRLTRITQRARQGATTTARCERAAAAVSRLRRRHADRRGAGAS